MWSRLTGKGKIKITLVKGNIEERKEPWTYQIKVENDGETKKSNPKTFYKDATISFDLADGKNQSIEVKGGDGSFKEGKVIVVIENGELNSVYKPTPTVTIFGIPTIVGENDESTVDKLTYWGLKKPDINKLIQYQIDQVKSMKNSARAKVGRGLISLKAGATQARQAFSRKKLTPVEKPAQSEALREEY